jgi:hypothetical protein
MTQWSHGFCIATCKICNRPVIYSETLIPKTQYGSVPFDPMTCVKNHYRAKHPNLFEKLFMNMKIPHPLMDQLINIKPKKHILPIHGGFNQSCWCGNAHRIVRGLKSHSYRKERKITMLEDIEKQ